MGFSWKSLVLAPLPAPLAFSVLFTASNGGNSPLFSFVFYFSLSALISYSTAIILFLPAVFCLSKFTNVRFAYLCVLGLLIGAAVYLPLTWQAYMSGGPNSGPPEGTYFQFLARSCNDAITWCFPISGLVTAFFFWLLNLSHSKEKWEISPRLH